MEVAEVTHIFELIFSTVKAMHLFGQKCFWLCTFWETFFTNPSGHPG
jgi:hypothetical protein